MKMRLEKKRILQAAVLALTAAALGCGCAALQNLDNGSRETAEREAAFAKAASEPTAPYPETVTYTLAKLTSSGDSLMPEGDTYEDNAYTRFLKDFLNVQNEDVIEVSEGENYDLYVDRLIAENQMPDVMLISDLAKVRQLAEEGLIEDLTAAYENCTSATVKEIYGSYGEELLDSVTIDGRLMALPTTQVNYGCSLFWVRQDWLEELHLDEPETLHDVEEIVLAFRENQMGGAGNVGLVCTDGLVGEGSANFSLDPVFGAFGAYPQIWIRDETGEVQYGSLSGETKAALACLHDWYEKGVLDEDYMMRTTTEIGKLVEEGHCGAFFGWWWAPNAPLLASVEADPDAVWKPYLIGDESGQVNSYIYAKGTQYIVVRKGYGHPEIVMKIITALFDNGRFQGDSTEEIDAYQAMGVDITARPLVINCDYSDAVFRTTDRIRAALQGNLDIGALSSLEQVYYRSCGDYLGGSGEPDDWAAYASRVEAVELMAQGNVVYVNEDYVQQSNAPVPQELLDMEILDFMKIVTGEEDLSYFDQFAESWEKNMFLENLSY